MTADDVVGRTQSFVQSSFLSGKPDVSLQADTRLFGNEIVDSMGALQLLEFLQSEFGVSISNYEVTEANLGSLDRIARFVLAKRS